MRYSGIPKKETSMTTMGIRVFKGQAFPGFEASKIYSQASATSLRIFLALGAACAPGQQHAGGRISDMI